MVTYSIDLMCVVERPGNGVEDKEDVDPTVGQRRAQRRCNPWCDTSGVGWANEQLCADVIKLRAWHWIDARFWRTFVRRVVLAFLPVGPELFLSSLPR